MNGDSTVTTNQCDRRMAEVRNETKDFCDAVFGKINELKDEIHESELERAKAQGAAKVEIVEERAARTAKDVLLDYKQEILWGILLALVGGGRVYDILSFLKVIH